MKKTNFIIVFLCSSFFSFSQLDYRQLKDSICPPKGFWGFGIVQIWPLFIQNSKIWIQRQSLMVWQNITPIYGKWSTNCMLVDMQILFS